MARISPSINCSAWIVILTDGAQIILLQKRYMFPDTFLFSDEKRELRTDLYPTKS
jgi:hypothetical protein